MRKATHELRLRGTDQRGMTLVELMVATMILGIVMIVVSSVFASIERSIVLQNNLSTTLDQGRLALEQLDRELRSGNVLYDPATENAGTTSCSGCIAGFTLRIYTQSNASTSAGYRCELWKIDTSEQLLVRTWAPDDPTGPSTTDWRIVATGVVNRTLSTTAFVLDPDTLKASRTVNITLSMNSDYSHHPSQTETLQAALTGRDTSYGFPSNVCSVVPSG